MEHDTVSPPGKKWTKKEIVELFNQGKTFEEIKAITGLPGKVLGGFKGYLRSPVYEGPPVRTEPMGEKTWGIEGNGGDGKQPLVRLPESKGAEPPPTPTSTNGPLVTLEAGPGEAQALTVLLGKPYLISVKNVYVSPDALKCYQVLVARGFKGSVGDFFELCVLKTFKELYGLVPGMIRPVEQQI